MKTSTIFQQYPISNDEYFELEKEFKKLTSYEAWQLLRKNKNNSHTDEFDDIQQELLVSLIKAGSYYKRQMYVENCLIRCIECIGGQKGIELLQFIIANSKPESYIYQESELVLAKASKQSMDNSDNFTMLVLQELVTLWINRTRHGASRQKFGDYQEKMLEKIVNKVVPVKIRPNRVAPLFIDTRFRVYCKAITWNTQKSMGRKITKEKPLRVGMVSLSNDLDYLATAGNGF